MAEPDLTELAVILQDTLGRIDNTIIITAPPAADLGSIGAVAIDLQNNRIYGPKTALGWGVGRPTVGGQGPVGPKGDKGDQGSVGPKGDKGDQGVQGGVGPKGDKGDQGLKGDKGDTGDSGPKGDKGDRGDAFTVNAQGSLAGRAAFDSEVVGFSYLDVDNGNLYFRVAPSGWSGAISFGKGEKGDKGDPGSDANVVFATVTEVRAGKVEGKIIPPKVMADALAPVVIARADAALGLNFDTFINCNIPLDANVTLGPPSGGYPGKSGFLTLSQNGTGGWLAALPSQYVLPDGGITQKTTAGGKTRIPYVIGGSLEIVLWPATKWV